MSAPDERSTVSVVPGRNARGFPLDYWRVCPGDAPAPLTLPQWETMVARYDYSDEAYDAAREAFPEAIITVG